MQGLCGAHSHALFVVHEVHAESRGGDHENFCLVRHATIVDNTPVLGSPA